MKKGFEQISLSINQWNIEQVQVYVFCLNSSSKQNKPCKNINCVRHIINSEKDEYSYMRTKRDLGCIFK